MYGEGIWNEAIERCLLVHPNARMLEETSDEQRQKHTVEADF